MNKLHLLLDYLLHVNSNKYHLHFIVLFCPDINNLGHVGGEAGKARVAGTPSPIGGNMATSSRLSERVHHGRLMKVTAFTCIVNRRVAITYSEHGGIFTTIFTLI
ncbi:hypothetical protein ACB295_08240 [Aeromonas caviae]|uniref:hypothetical protein n=1 Tax=Aeromonas TaxID=642 RepID=UPI0022E7B4DA|nr:MULTISPECIES: hypothetical protein [Aeromonas]MDX7735767.1 hypothetical protein [Aeromonas caviae]